MFESMIVDVRSEIYVEPTDEFILSCDDDKSDFILYGPFLVPKITLICNHRVLSIIQSPDTDFYQYGELSCLRFIVIHIIYFCYL
ncbi:hypothetical protein MHBO_000436 [Bonamia ostreae]|uniref:Uncharacterized protein n=1 Tax=Bonamia ostreae TaxID=126728 RepID=A0ABV2AFJ4_9EUKA